MNYIWLKRSRVILSLLVLSSFFLVFIDIYEFIPISIKKTLLFLQFMPSLLLFAEAISISAVGFILIVIISLLFGRIYCSTLCPLGILQDFVNWIAKFKSSKKRFFKYKKEHTKLRYSLLAITILALIIGIPLIITLLDPYSIAGRFFTYLFKPVIIFFNNLIAEGANSIEWYSIYKVKVITVPFLVLLINVLFAISIAFMAYKRGRLFCNTICPVGSFLGLISKFSLLKIHINNEKCTLCGKCAGVCKSECIDLKTNSIDYSRCVECYNCLAVCEDSAINYHNLKPIKQKQQNEGRREALAGLLMLAGSAALKAQENKPQKKSKTGKVLTAINRKHPVSPPGSKSTEHFNDICTGCGLCVSACPTSVLRPAFTEYGYMGFMQPHLNYAVGECNFDCTACGDVCPTGAILSLKQEEKHILQLGKAKFVKENCIVFTDETACGACSEHCPTKAVDMVPYKGKLLIPEVNEDICVGCGACEHPCPLEPDYKAIYIDGNPIHLTADKPKEEQSITAPEEDFPF